MKKKKKNNVIGFVSKGQKKDGESALDHGKIGSLDYELHARGSIHIIDKNNNRFKKDPILFEEALDNLDLDSIRDGEETLIEGSGDNPNLIFTKKDGDIKLSLRKKEYGTISKLRNLLRRAKGKKKAV